MLQGRLKNNEKGLQGRRTMERIARKMTPENGLKEEAQRTQNAMKTKRKNGLQRRIPTNAYCKKEDTRTWTARKTKPERRPQGRRDMKTKRK